MKHKDAFTKCGTGQPRDKAVLFYSLRRNQKIHYRNVTSAISSKIIPGTSPDLNRELIQVDNDIVMPSNALLEKQITSLMFPYLETSYKEHIICFPLAIFLLKTELY